MQSDVSILTEKFKIQDLESDKRRNRKKRNEQSIISRYQGDLAQLA